MAKRKRSRKSQPPQEFPGWVWMLFGLGIGLSVALVIYLSGRPRIEPVRPVASEQRPEEPSAIDDNGELAKDTTVAPAASRFDFYDMLPNFEVVIPEQEPDVRADTEPRAISAPGTYVLQAGSFTKYEDADRRRAQLALQGIESRIQRVSIDEKTYHRVRIGPIDDLDELNVLRSRLRQAQIDVLRIRLGN